LKKFALKDVAGGYRLMVNASPFTKLTPEDVSDAYRSILGREPESDAAIRHHLARHTNVQSLRQALLSSKEYHSRASVSYFQQEVARGYDTPPCRIDTEVPAPVMAQLLERIRRQWTILGEEEPYWGVLTDDRFKSDMIDEGALAAFRDSGLGNVLMIDNAIQRGLPSRIGGTCVELGCGVGRITRHLAGRFDKVIAVDISPGNLRLCEQYLANAGIGNVETLLLQNLDDLAHIGPFDWFYSVIVLQHNPPPIQRLVLESLLPQIRSGGGFIFQTISDLPGYEFIAEQYLATDDPVMEIHSLPQRSVFKLIDNANLKLNAVRMDAMLQAYGSYTYEGYKP
jgi:SAM-dependent methyltransferase